MLSSITDSLCEVVVTANGACTTSLTAWERSLFDVSCSQAWAWQRQLLVDLQCLRHGSCQEALLVSRTPPTLFLCALVRCAWSPQPPWARTQGQPVCFSSPFPVPGGAGKVCVRWLSFTSVCQAPHLYSLPAWKAAPKNACLWGEWARTPNETPLTLFSRMWPQIPETSPSWTSCPCPLCFKDHVPYMHLNTLYFTHVRPKCFPLTSLLLPQCTFTFTCLTFISALYHCKTEKN